MAAQSMAAPPCGLRLDLNRLCAGCVGFDALDTIHAGIFGLIGFALRDYLPVSSLEPESELAFLVLVPLEFTSHVLLL